MTRDELVAALRRTSGAFTAEARAAADMLEADANLEERWLATSRAFAREADALRALIREVVALHTHYEGARGEPNPLNISRDLWARLQEATT